MQTYDPSQFQTGYDPNLTTYMATQQQLNSGAELQTQPQFQVGTSDTGYGGQFGASTEFHTAGQVSSSTATSNIPPGGYHIEHRTTGLAGRSAVWGNTAPRAGDDDTGGHRISATTAGAGRWKCCQCWWRRRAGSSDGI